MGEGRVRCGSRNGRGRERGTCGLAGGSKCHGVIRLGLDVDAVRARCDIVSVRRERVLHVEAVVRVGMAPAAVHRFRERSCARVLLKPQDAQPNKQIQQPHIYIAC